MNTAIKVGSKENQHFQIAKKLNIFYDEELKILKEVLRDHKYARNGYILLDEKREGRVCGFVLFGRIPITVFGWDIYWLVVDKDLQGQGIGKSLLKKVEEYILTNHLRANIRVETSTRKEYAHARNLYTKLNFQQVGQIADFYDRDDDVVIFYKQISRPDPNIS